MPTVKHFKSALSVATAQAISAESMPALSSAPMGTSAMSRSLTDSSSSASVSSTACSNGTLCVPASGGVQEHCSVTFPFRHSTMVVADLPRARVNGILVPTQPNSRNSSTASGLISASRPAS